ncbi:MAG: bifunctional hydroxymethylpyrimidine kinase/phosphomethylpyrimidine kinase, partial [Jannaschia sp.]
LGVAEARNLDEMRAQGAALLGLGCGAVLIKGGHLASEDATDLLMSPGAVLELTAPRTPTRNTHGTGCTLSSALAAWMGAGHPAREAAGRAKAYVAAAIAAADTPTVGSGHGPVDHFHALRETRP